ncbi:Bax inhibitor 1 [Dimargaris verticillata]|uniref:Bax inhibitor 1 n=1 Tax=Dimargaris verticillata TaxID=2761393 RepID=A0A9W8B6Z2_9FUNG|nr:Bax inhibitor 1 [Dimargaris verticillata]
MAGLFDTFGGGSVPTFATLTKSANLTRVQQDHLVRVYTWLAATTGTAALGTMLTFMYHWTVNPTLALLGAVACMVYIGATDNGGLQATKTWTRSAALLVFGLLQGLSVGPLVAYTLHFQPNTLIMTLVGTALIFGCFTVSALTNRSRSWLYFGGTLGSAVGVLSLLSLVNSLFFGSKSLFSLELYLGLVLFSAYIVYDTQLILQRVDLGSRDAVGHALTLFVDLFAVFIRILVILLQNQERRDDRRNRRRRSDL